MAEQKESSFLDTVKKGAKAFSWKHAGETAKKQKIRALDNIKSGAIEAIEAGKTENVIKKLSGEK